jgi:hypothetical protein
VCPLCHHAQPRTVDDELPPWSRSCADSGGAYLGPGGAAPQHTRCPFDAMLVVCPTCDTSAVVGGPG